MADLRLPDDDERRLLVHRERAAALMQEHGFDALAAAQPVNVYYLTSFWSVLARMGFDFPSLALLSRAAAQRDAPGHALVASAAQIWLLENGEVEYPPEIHAYTAPANWQQWSDSGATVPLAAYGATPWRIDEPALASTIEQGWARASRRIAGREAATPEDGLAQALRDAGLARGRVATDDPRLGAMLARAGLDGLRTVYAPNLFRRLRMVKSPAELRLMRMAATLNAEACRATVAALEPGMTMREIEAMFGVEVARRGGEAVFIVAGGTGHLPKGEIRRGEPFIIDAVSHYRHYHGDFGRTVVVGEPDRETLRRVDALRVGWEASFEALRPGVRYSAVRQAGLDAMRGCGAGDVLTVANPHSVGLQHTDEPFREGLPFAVKDDLVLEAGMTLTVDFPHIEVGWGAAHLEDLVAIGADGAQPLERMDSPLIVVPG